MTTIALKKYLVSRINLIEDEETLNKIKNLVAEKEYVLSKEQLEKVEKSRTQIKAGLYSDDDDMEKIVEGWLNEK